MSGRAGVGVERGRRGRFQVHRDVAQLLGFVRAVQAADTTGVAVDAAPVSVAVCPVRADEARPVPAAQALANAPVTVGSYFAAPKGRAFAAMDGGGEH